MANIFIGQRIADEYGEELKEESMNVIGILKKAGHDAYCTLCEEESFQETPKGWLEHAFNEIDKRDTFLAIIRSEKKSEGLLIEIGYVLSKGKRLIVAIKKEVRDKTYVDDLANEVIEFEKVEDLYEKLEDLK